MKQTFYRHDRHRLRERAARTWGRRTRRSARTAWRATSAWRASTRISSWAPTSTRPTSNARRASSARIRRPIRTRWRSYSSERGKRCIFPTTSSSAPPTRSTSARWRRLFQKIHEQRLHLRGQVQRLYCEGCEEFKIEKDLVDGKCPRHLTVPKFIEENELLLRALEVRDRLKAAHRSPTRISFAPRSARNEILKVIESGLEDVSVSRSGKTWGVPLPIAPDQVVYVWFDALINYISALGYGRGLAGRAKFKKYWPADVHIIGKDITRFHCLIWPAMLMAADVEVAHSVFGHGFVYNRGEKMSKTHRQHRRSDRPGELLRRGCAALPVAARDRVRPRRRFHRRAVRDALQCRARQRAGQPFLAHAVDDEQVLRRRGAGVERRGGARHRAAARKCGRGLSAPHGSARLRPGAGGGVARGAGRESLRRRDASRGRSPRPATRRRSAATMRALLEVLRVCSVLASRSCPPRREEMRVLLALDGRLHAPCLGEADRAGDAAWKTNR